MAAAQSCLRLQDEARRALHTGETNTWEGDRIKSRRAPHTGETNTWETEGTPNTDRLSFFPGSRKIEKQTRWGEGRH